MLIILFIVISLSFLVTVINLEIYLIKKSINEWKEIFSLYREVKQKRNELKKLIN